jgi:UDP-N-acetylglucosamine 4,6-dehydratase
MDWKSRTILVTGGTGSFGRRFTETILEQHPPKKLIILSRDELKQSEMRTRFPEDQYPIRYFIGDVRDRSRLHRAFHGVDIVVHAAALKQVPACEYNPIEAVRTNIDGAANIIEAAIDQGVERVLALSTDKAVNPVNLYGATKLCSEKLFVQGNSYSGIDGTAFSCVRYGNVVGSRGSVIPIFLEQRKTGRLTITDPRMTRFWITLQQGVDFVIWCIEQMRGGEIFVPKIPSMAVTDLAKALAPDAEVEYVGIRPGEKLHELLFSDDEARQVVDVDEAYIIKPVHPWWETEGWNHGQPLTEGFRYASDMNSQWLTADQLHELIEPELKRNSEVIAPES